MIVQQLVFYLFSFVAIASAVMVISARNPVHSVLFLILAFFNAAGLFVLIGAEFLAMVLVVVYVGAVAVALHVRGHDARHQFRTATRRLSCNICLLVFSSALSWRSN